jgi:hypothetical protein
MEVETDDFRVTLDPRISPPIVSDTLNGDFVRCRPASSVAPAFLIIRPFPPSVAVPVIDCSRGDSPRCGTCRVFLSPFCKIAKKAKSFRCPFCGHINATIHFTWIYDMRTGSSDRPELHSLVFDVIPPRTLEVLRGRARVFVILVDENLLDTSSPHCENFLRSLEAAQSSSRPTDEIALMTFGDFPAIVNLQTRMSRPLSPELPVGSSVFFRAEETFGSLVEVLRDMAGGGTQPQASLYGALHWATVLMDGVGGRLLLFTSGRATDECVDLFPRLLSKSVSLSVFKATSLGNVELWAQMTGGVVGGLGNVPAITSLFKEETAWFGSVIMRTNGAAQLAGVMGPCCRTEHDVVLTPALTGGNSVVYEFGDVTGELRFQIALRHLDDAGRLRIRVINGQLPNAVAKVDEAAMALYASRKLVYERDTQAFYRVIREAKEWMADGSLFPVLAFSGSVKDQGFVMGSSVEKFAMAVVVTKVVIGDTEFKVVWAPDFNMVWPRLSDEQEEVMREAGRGIGIPQKEFFYPENEEEFELVNIEARQAAQWFQGLSGQ